MHGGPSPCLVSRRARGTGNTPDVLRIVRELLGKIGITPFAMRPGGSLAVGEPIHLCATTLAASAEIEPGEGILVGPQQGVTDVVVLAVAIRSAFPGIPGIWRQGMCRRSDPEQ